MVWFVVRPILIVPENVALSQPHTKFVWGLVETMHPKGDFPFLRRQSNVDRSSPNFGVVKFGQSLSEGVSCGVHVVQDMSNVFNLSDECVPKILDVHVQMSSQRPVEALAVPFNVLRPEAFGFSPSHDVGRGPGFEASPLIFLLGEL